MKRILKFMVGLFLVAFAAQGLNAQCATWNDSPQKDEAENAHTIYRDALKTKDYALAFEHWQTAYSIAPAADGRRDFHFTDGAKIYTQMFKDETDAEKKKEYAENAMRLMDEAAACYADKSIALKCSTDDCYKEKQGYIYGRKAFEMYYTFNSPYSKNLAALEKAVELGGNATEYIVFDPYSAIVVYQFEKGKMDKMVARAAYEKLNAIADHNIANNEKYGDAYAQSKERMNGVFRKIERDIFDCEFFKNKMRPEYEADKDNPDVIKKVLGILKGQGCEPGDPFYDELDGKWKQYASAENAKIQANFEASNPGMMAKKMYDEGKFAEAIAKYDEAIAAESDPQKQASYYFSKASIEFRKLKKYSTARASARKAGELRPGWGRPYMLIGDMYGSSARSCGDSWNQRLAILAAIDKYNYAKSIDASVAQDAAERVSKYRASMPSQDEGFMRGVKAGQSVKVGCWIGESVKVRYN